MTDESTFREVLSHFPSGVTVLTLRAADGTMRGMTISAFSSLSLHPPLVLACVAQSSACHDALTDGMAFAVSILAETAEDVARHFATPLPDKFRDFPFHIGVLGAPLLDAACASLECTVAARYAAGDHAIVVGQVETATVRGGRPLVYAQRAFHRLVA